MGDLLGVGLIEARQTARVHAHHLATRVSHAPLIAVTDSPAATAEPGEQLGFGAIHPASEDALGDAAFGDFPALAVTGSADLVGPSESIREMPARPPNRPHANQPNESEV